jgi:hypothetical protein
MVVVAELFFHPAGQRRRFVIEKDPSILDRRLALNVTTRTNKDLIMRLDRNVSPPIPGRHANLFGQVINAEDSSALIAARDDQRARDAGPGTLDGLNQE